MISDSNSTPNEHRNGSGVLLREAREAAGMALEDVSARLRMPVQVIHALEEEDWARLGAPVYVRGQLRSYAKLLKVDLGPLLQSEPVTRIEPVELVSHTHTPPLRRFLENTARRAVYVVMTGVLAVPVWYATRSHVEGTAPRTASLDEVPPAVAPVPPTSVVSIDSTDPASTVSPAVTTPSETADTVAPAQPEARRAAPTPYIASMAPVPHSQPVAAASALSFRFSGDSWVQILSPDGRTVEKALLKSGDERHYDAGQVGRVVLGNANAVEVQHSGSIVDLKPYQHANVARFAVSSDGSVVPASE